MSQLNRRIFLSRSVRGAAVAGLIFHTHSLRAQQARKSGGLEPYTNAVAVGNKGVIYVADHVLKTIYRLGEGNKLEVVYKGSQKYRTPLFRVFAMAQDGAGNLFLCDTGTMDVWRLSPDGKLKPLTGAKIARGRGPVPADQDFDAEAAYAGKFDKPMGIVIEPDGNLVIADLGLNAIFRLSPEGGEPREIARVPAPHGITLDHDGTLVVVSQGKDQLLRVSPKGEVTPIVQGALAPKNNPHYVAVDKAGYIVSDNYASAIWRVTPDGQVSPIAQGTPLDKPVGLALEADGNILVADPWAKKLFRVSPQGQVNTVVSFATPSD